MKTSRTTLKSSLLLLGLVAFPLWAKPVAMITELKGSVFAVTPDGKTTSLKVNSKLEDKTEIMVEEGASVGFNDYYDATYHMIGGSHMKLFDKSVQLKRGKAWIESKNARHPLALTTANGHADFWKGEFIVTFDQATSRSQILVVNGDVEVSNILDKNMKYTVSAGSFSLIDPDVENGTPRAPTKVGLSSLNSALAEFKQLPREMKATDTTTKTAERSVASVVENTDQAPVVKKGEIIFMSSGRLPASVEGGAYNYFKKKVVKAKADTSTGTPIRFYGSTWKATTPAFTAPATQAASTLAPRAPASIAPIRSSDMPNKAAAEFNLDTEFGASLKDQSDKQPKYPKELDNLIQDLKSY